MKTRPYWFIDAKWISGIIFFLLCGPMLLALGLNQATSETMSIRIFSLVATETKLTTTPAETKKLAEAIFAKGTPALIDRLPDEKSKKSLEAAETWINLFTRPANNWFRTVFFILLGLELLPLSLLIFFSYRFGRIKSPGYAMLLGGLPGLILTTILRNTIVGSDLSLPVGEGLAVASGGLASTRLMLPIIQKLSGPFYAFVYLGLGLVLLSLTLELAFVIKRSLKKPT